MHRSTDRPAGEAGAQGPAAPSARAANAGAGAASAGAASAGAGAVSAGAANAGAGAVSAGAVGAGAANAGAGAVSAGAVRCGGGGYRLLAADEPPPFIELGRHGRSNFVIVVDHASCRIPRALGGLGLPAAELERHIGWDIGALGVARRMAATLDAPLIAQNYSRLVIDCNRDPAVATSIPTVGEHIEIPGNIGLSAECVAARRAEIFEPYHRQVRALLDERAAAGQPTILIAQHSMTSVFKGVRREMHAAVLYNRDRRFAALVLDRLRAETGLVIGDNEPYFVSDETDYTIPRHAEARGLAHVEIEIRQDLITGDAGQDQWARRLCRVLQSAEQAFLGTTR